MEEAWTALLKQDWVAGMKSHVFKQNSAETQFIAI